MLVGANGRQHCAHGSDEVTCFSDFLTTSWGYSRPREHGPSLPPIPSAPRRGWGRRLSAFSALAVEDAVLRITDSTLSSAENFNRTSRAYHGAPCIGGLPTRTSCR